MQTALVDTRLLHGLNIPCGDAVHGLGHERRSGVHQFVVHRAHVVFRKNRHAHLRDDRAFVYFVVEQERRDAGLGFAVDDGPVDRRGPAVLRKQRGVQVECSQPRHGPDHFGKHAERDDDPQIGFQRLHGFDELRRFQLFGLQYRKSQFERGQLNLALMQFLAPSGGFVGRCDHGHDVVAPGDQRPERRYGEFGRTHKYDAQLFRIHCSSYVMLRLLCVMRAF